jgi:large subunit ribosomal protein L25
MSLTIECQKRPEGSKPNALRREGLVPANLYGHNGTESIHLTVDAKAAQFLLRDAVVRKSEIEVNIPDLKWSGKALIQEVQAHPAKGFLYHLSFLAV